MGRWEIVLLLASGFTVTNFAWEFVMSRVRHDVWGRRYQADYATAFRLSYHELFAVVIASWIL